MFGSDEEPFAIRIFIVMMIGSVKIFLARLFGIYIYILSEHIPKDRVQIGSGYSGLDHPGNLE